MAKRALGGLPAQYEQNVFINCPFDEIYLPLFQALIFAVFECGLRPRCALEVSDAGEVRFEKIIRIVGDCRWGIHDISRTDLNPKGLPRFNMPFELGLFLGARKFGVRAQTTKSCLILDRDQYRYQEFISDIAGQDIAAHHNRPEQAILAVRNWLRDSHAGNPSPPGAAEISRRFDRFAAELPAICAATDLEVDRLTYVEFADTVATWSDRQIAAERSTSSRQVD